MYHPKYRLRYYLKHIKFKWHIVSALAFLLVSRPISNFLCTITDVRSIGLEYIFNDGYNDIFKIMIPIVLLTIWCIIVVWDLCNQFYMIETGRKLSTDRRNYGRSFSELLKFFKEADPTRLDVNGIAALNWKKANGLIFGKVADKLIYYTPYKNGVVAMVWGAPGDGKTTSIIIPSCRQFGMEFAANGTLLQNGAVMVLDLKGDIYNANRNYRRIKRFTTIHVEESAHFDPLISARSMDIGARATFLENMAITIISDDGGSESKYFTSGARDFFTGIALFLLNQNNDIAFPDIIEKIITGSYSKWVVEIMKSSDITAQSYTNRFYGENEKNVAGTYSKLVSATRFFGSSTMKELLRNKGEQIAPSDLENCTDIYIQVNPNQMELMAPVVAMIFQTFLSAMLYRKEGQTPPIAFIIDEFGQLPAMPIITQAAALLRAYNCSLMLSCQSLAMVEKHYGIAGRKMLMDCTKIHCFLSAMDPDTRDWASKLFGMRKALKVSTSEQSSTDHSSNGRTVNEVQEPIFAPDDFGSLPMQNAVAIYYKGKYVKAQKTYYNGLYESVCGNDKK